MTRRRWASTIAAVAALPVVAALPAAAVETQREARRASERAQQRIRWLGWQCAQSELVWPSEPGYGLVAWHGTRYVAVAAPTLAEVPHYWEQVLHAVRREWWLETGIPRLRERGAVVVPSSDATALRAILEDARFSVPAAGRRGGRKAEGVRLLGWLGAPPGPLPVYVSALAQEAA